MITTRSREDRYKRNENCASVVSLSCITIVEHVIIVSAMDSGENTLILRQFSSHFIVDGVVVFVTFAALM